MMTVAYCVFYFFILGFIFIDPLFGAPRTVLMPSVLVVLILLRVFAFRTGRFPSICLPRRRRHLSHLCRFFFLVFVFL